MAADDWTLGLVFRDDAGRFYDEPRRYRAPLPRTLALARRDAAAAAFGRAFLGFSALTPTPLHAPPGEVLLARQVPEDPTRALDELLAAHEVVDPGEVDPESPRVASLDGLRGVRWWAHEGAFGLATEVGVHLDRCASAHADEATTAAALLGEAIAHQQQLFSATAAALPFVVTLLEAPGVHARDPLAQWLQIIATSAHEANDTTSNLLALAARLVARDLAGAMQRHQAAAKETGEVLARLRPRLEGLAQDPVVGPRVTALLPQVRERL